MGDSVLGSEGECLVGAVIGADDRYGKTVYVTSNKSLQKWIVLAQGGETFCWEVDLTAILCATLEDIAVEDIDFIGIDYGRYAIDLKRKK